jgi:hypothetical protein
MARRDLAEFSTATGCSWTEGTGPVGAFIQALQMGHCSLAPNMSASTESFCPHEGQ